MNELIKLTAGIKNTLGLTLILTRDRARKSKTDLIAGLILNGPLFIIAADEWLPSYTLPYMLLTNTARVKEIVNNLRVVRTSTCYRLLDSLSKISEHGEPILVLDFLHMFYDPNIRLNLRLRVLRQSCDHLKRLAFHRPVIVMVQEMPVEDYDKFLPMLLPVSRRTLYLELEPEKTHQPALF